MKKLVIILVCGSIVAGLQARPSNYKQQSSKKITKSVEITVDNVKSQKDSKVEFKYNHGQEVTGIVKAGEMRVFKIEGFCVDNIEIAQRHNRRDYEVERCIKLCGKHTVQIVTDVSQETGFRVMIYNRHSFFGLFRDNK